MGGKVFVMAENHKWTVVVATKDKPTRKLVEATLNDPKSRVIAVSSVKEFFEILSENDIDLIIYDPKITSLKGLDAFSIAKSYHANIPSILVYEQEKYEVTRSVLDKGVIYRMLKPINEEQLKQIDDSIREPKTTDH